MNFDSIASWYRWLEWSTFGHALQRCRTAFIGEAANARNALILGEGDGRLLERLLEVNKTAAITVIDSSPRMVELARRRVGGNSRVRFVCGDARRVMPRTGEFDLVITAFFLDCFRAPDVALLVGSAATRLVDGGLWLWSDFVPPGRGPLRWPNRCIIAVLIRFFRLTSRLEADRIVPCDGFLRSAGLGLLAERRMCGGLLAAQLWQCHSGPGLGAGRLA